MNTAFQASVFIAVAFTMLATAEDVAARECPSSSGCTGMTLTQSAAPNEDAPNSDSGAPPSGANPDQGSGDDHAQSPGDNDDRDDDGSDSDQASPPDSAQPPGCIFQDRPLELLV